MVSEKRTCCWKIALTAASNTSFLGQKNRRDVFFPHLASIIDSICPMTRTCFPTRALLLMRVCKLRMPRHSLAERNLRAEYGAGNTVLALHPHNLDLPRQTPDAKDRTDYTVANFANILKVLQGLTTMLFQATCHRKGTSILTLLPQCPWKKDWPLFKLP